MDHPFCIFQWHSLLCFYFWFTCMLSHSHLVGCLSQSQSLTSTKQYCGTCKRDKDGLIYESSFCIFSVAFVVVLLLLVARYAHIWLVVRRSRKALQAYNNIVATAKKEQLRREMRLAQTMLIIMTVYVVTYIPKPIMYQQEMLGRMPLPILVGYN